MSERLDVDRLAAGTAVDVIPLRGFTVGRDRPIRAPHRHDYHELLWFRAGAGEQRVDGEPLPIVPGTVTVVARGQVHQFVSARGIDGALLRITEAAIATGWLVAPGRGGRTIAVPPSERDRLSGVLDALHAETRRPPDPYAPDLVRHLVATVLLWLDRWHDASTSERPDDADPAATALHRRFAQRLEQDYNKHHDVAHYADALGVPAAALARALTAVTGRSTKELIVERALVEAMRLLRFTDLTVGEIAFRTGYRDPLYFSRAFKRFAGRAPLAYREEVHGSAPIAHAGRGTLKRP